MTVAFGLRVCVCAVDGESADDRYSSVGEVVRPGLQFPGGRRRHRRGGLPLLCGPGRPHWGHEAPPGPALLRILYAAHVTAVITLTSYTSCITFNYRFDMTSDINPRCEMVQRDPALKHCYCSCVCFCWDMTD